MGKTTNLDSGFLLLYDWLPAIRSLDGEGVKELLLALIARQREGTAFPTFQNAQVEIYARMIEPTIQRRLVGLSNRMSKSDEEACTQPCTQPYTQPCLGVSRAEQSTAEQSRAELSIAELRGAEQEAVPCAPRACPTAPPMTEEERDRLVSKGIPSGYVDERRERANAYAAQHGTTAYDTILDWWKTDRTQPPWNRSQTPDLHRATSQFSTGSFDTNDFFQAALARSWQRGALQ